jgi:hypothetical protein
VTEHIARQRVTIARLVLVVCLTLLCTAPTPGDVGGCGQPARDLDPEAFFQEKRRIDCSHCTECGIRTESCDVACSEEPPPIEGFPAGCYPLVHDGEVCLRALDDASCDEYRPYVADEAPQVPSECNFCPPREDE